MKKWVPLLAVLAAVLLWVATHFAGEDRATPADEEPNGAPPELIGMGGAPGDEEPDEPETPNPDVVFRLVDEEGKPIQGAEVAVQFKERDVPIPVFEVLGDEPVDWWIQDGQRMLVRAKGYMPWISPPLFRGDKQRIDLGTIVVQRGKTISGVVVSRDGTPLGGSLRLLPDESPIPPSWEAMVLTTDYGAVEVDAGEDGTFAFEGLPDATYRLVWDGEGAPQRVFEGIRAGQTGLRFEVPVDAATKFRVRALDAAGDPIPLYRVLVFDEAGEVLDWEHGGKNGASFSLTSPPPYRVVVDRPRKADRARTPLPFAPWLQDGVVPAKLVTARLGEGLTLQGRIVDVHGKPPLDWDGVLPKGVEVEASWTYGPDGRAVGKDNAGLYSWDALLGRASPAGAAARTSITGHFELQGLPPGTVALRLKDKRRALREVQRHLETGTRGWTLTCETKPKMTVIVEAPPGARLDRANADLLFELPGGGTMPIATTPFGRHESTHASTPARELRLEFDGFARDVEAAEVLSLCVEAGGALGDDAFATARRCQIPLDAREVRVQLAEPRNAKIEGVVVDAAGAPVPFAEVRLASPDKGAKALAAWWPDGAVFVPPMKRHFGRADGTGSFSFELTEAALSRPWFIAAAAPEFGYDVRASGPQRVRPGERQTVVVRERKTITGRIEFEGDGPCPALLLVAWGIDRGSRAHYGWAEPDGYFVIGGVGEGRYRVALHMPRGKLLDPIWLLSEPVVAGARDVRVTVAEGRTIQGRCVDTDGEPIVLARVSIRGEFVSRDAPSEWDGVIRWGALPRAPLDVRAWTADGRAGEVHLSATQDQFEVIVR